MISPAAARVAAGSCGGGAFEGEEPHLSYCNYSTLNGKVGFTINRKPGTSARLHR